MRNWLYVCVSRRKVQIVGHDHQFTRDPRGLELSVRYHTHTTDFRTPLLLSLYDHHQTTMTLVKCPGCPKKFDNGRGLSTHQRRCPGLEVMVKTRFKKRQENLKKRLAVKLAHQSQKAARDDFRERTNSFLSVR